MRLPGWTPDQSRRRPLRRNISDEERRPPTWLSLARAADHGEAPLPEARGCGPLRSLDGTPVDLEVSVAAAFIERRRVFGLLLRSPSSTHPPARRSASKGGTFADQLAERPLLTVLDTQARPALKNIIGFSEILAREILGELGSESYCRYATNIFSTCQQLLARIKAIRDIERLQEGAIPTNDQWFDVAALFNDVLSSANPERQRGQPQIVVRSAIDHVHVFGDREVCRQILFHLHLNALASSLASECVTPSIHQADDGGCLVVKVQDCGPAMEAAIRREIFSPVNVSGIELTPSLIRHGAGPDWFLARALAQPHGGDLEVETSASEGTCAFLRFPPWRLDIDTHARTDNEDRSDGG